MSDQNELVPLGQMTISEVMSVGKVMASSGYFQDAKDAAQAVVKILAGREMGFGPFASMTGVSIIQGKPTIGANLMAAAVKNNPRYDYRIVRLDNEGCELAFFEGARELGRSLFTVENATAAGLTTKENWRKYPRNMYFARALSNGVRWYCPDVFNGNTVYTPEELGATVNEDGTVLDLKPTIIQSIDERDTKSNGQHWIDKVDKNGHPVRERFWAWAKSTLGLTEAQVYTALGVESIHLYEGTMADAKTQITKWIAEQQAAEESHATDAEMTPAEEAA